MYYVRITFTENFDLIFFFLKKNNNKNLRKYKKNILFSKIIFLGCPKRNKAFGLKLWAYYLYMYLHMPTHYQDIGKVKQIFSLCVNK
jgi:hypothetical protein